MKWTQMVTKDGSDVIELVGAFLVGLVLGAERLKRALADAGLSVREDGRTKGKDSIILLWQVGGRPSAHQRMYDTMINDPDVKEFEL